MTLLEDTSLDQAISDGLIMITDPVPSYDSVQPASVDIMMGGQVKRQIKTGYAVSPFAPPVFDAPWDDEVFTLYPNEFYLANTLQTFRLAPSVAGQLHGKSSWGRCGLEVHSTAGWIDPGFHGQITLEMKVVGVDPVTIHKGDMIAQISFHQLQRAASVPYGSARNHYQGQMGATEVRNGRR
jgi:dCTP deaminase